MLSSGIVGAITVNATISATPTAYVSPYSCEKGINYIITVDNSVVPVYYAIAGIGTATVSCGNLAFGGPSNAGGVTGTNATSVIQAAINALPTGTSVGIGEVYFEPGNYTIRTLVIPNSDHSTIILAGQSDLNTELYYKGSNTKQVIWEPWVFAKYSISHLQVEIDNLHIKVGSITYTGNAIDMTIVPEVTMSHDLIEAAGVIGNVGSVGLLHNVPKGDGNAKELYDVHINGFGTDMVWGDDLAVMTGLYIENYVTTGIRFGNSSALGFDSVTLINPHIRNNNALLTAGHGLMIQFNYTTTAQGAEVTIVNPFFEVNTTPQCEFDFRGVGGSNIVMTGFSDSTQSSTYPRVCLPVAGDLSKIQFHTFQAPGIFGFPYFRACNYFGLSSSRMTCTGSSSSATPLSGVAYQDWGLPTMIQISGGTGVNITINSPANNNMIKNLATIGVGQPFELPVGYKLIVTYATPPTTIAFVVAN